MKDILELERLKLEQIRLDFHDKVLKLCIVPVTILVIASITYALVVFS